MGYPERIIHAPISLLFPGVYAHVSKTLLHRKFTRVVLECVTIRLVTGKMGNGFLVNFDDNKPSHFMTEYGQAFLEGLASELVVPDTAILKNTRKAFIRVTALVPLAHGLKRRSEKYFGQNLLTWEEAFCLGEHGPRTCNIKEFIFEYCQYRELRSMGVENLYDTHRADILREFLQIDY